MRINGEILKIDVMWALKSLKLHFRRRLCFKHPRFTKKLLWVSLKLLKFCFKMSNIFVHNVDSKIILGYVLQSSKSL